MNRQDIPNLVSPNLQLVRSQINTLRLDIGQINPFLRRNKQARICEDHFSALIVQEFPDERAIGVPYVGSVPTA